MRNNSLWVTEERSFVVLRALAMLGGMVAILLVPHPPEHQPYLGGLAWGFVAYKVGLFAAIWAWPAQLRAVLLASVCLDLAFVSLFVWFGGGIGSHFYLLFYLLVALVSTQYAPGIGLATAGAAGGLYAVASVGHADESAWQHLVARVATFFLLAGSLGYLSQRARMARARAEELNRSLQENQTRLERAYRDLQSAQARLVQSERLAAIGQMSAKVSHEVRNPLSSISLNVELLEDEVASIPAGRRAEVARLLGAVRSQVDVLSAVTEEYLRCARVPKPKREPCALQLITADLVDFVREELRARKVELLVNAPEDLPTVRVDPAQIRQLLLNLIRNAAEAMPEGGTIRIETQLSAHSGGAGGEVSRGVIGVSPPAFVKITITDTGVGIPAEELEKVFEPFFTSKEGGTGLGLAISREIALEHGGTLRCESTPGSGTTFYLALPMIDEEPQR